MSLSEYSPKSPIRLAPDRDIPSPCVYNKSSLRTAFSLRFAHLCIYHQCIKIRATINAITGFSFYQLPVIETHFFTLLHRKQNIAIIVDIFVDVQRCLYAISNAKQLLVILELLQIGIRRTCRYFMDSMFLDTRWNFRRTKSQLALLHFSSRAISTKLILATIKQGAE